MKISVVVIVALFLLVLGVSSRNTNPDPVSFVNTDCASNTLNGINGIKFYAQDMFGYDLISTRISTIYECQQFCTGESANGAVGFVLGINVFDLQVHTEWGTNCWCKYQIDVERLNCNYDLAFFTISIAYMNYIAFQEQRPKEVVTPAVIASYCGYREYDCTFPIINDVIYFCAGVYLHECGGGCANFPQSDLASTHVSTYVDCLNFCEEYPTFQFAVVVNQFDYACDQVGAQCQVSKTYIDNAVDGSNCWCKGSYSLFSLEDGYGEGEGAYLPYCTQSYSTIMYALY